MRKHPHGGVPFQGGLPLGGPEESSALNLVLGYLAALLNMVDCSMLPEAYAQY